MVRQRAPRGAMKGAVLGLMGAGPLLVFAAWRAAALPFGFVLSLAAFAALAGSALGTVGGPRVQRLRLATKLEHRPCWRTEGFQGFRPYRKARRGRMLWHFDEEQRSRDGRKPRRKPTRGPTWSRALVAFAAFEYVVGLALATAFFVWRDVAAGSPPLAVHQVVVLFVVVLAVSAPITLPPVLVCTWILERRTRSDATR